MPIFEFSCSDCGQAFEDLLRNTDAVSQVTCPRCGSLQVRKKISSFASRITGGTSSLSASSAPACSPAEPEAFPIDRPCVGNQRVPYALSGCRSG